MIQLATQEIPAIRELAKYPNWVLYNLKKIPFQANGKPADTTDSNTWSDVDTAIQMAESREMAGVGFVFSKNLSYVGIDIDKCIDEGGKLYPWADEIVKHFDSFTEYSMSRRGIHIYINTQKPINLPWNRIKIEGSSVEIYNKDRYFAMVFEVFPGCSEEIIDRTKEVEEFLAKYGKGEREVVKPEPESVQVDLSSVQFPEEKFQALLENDSKFNLTWSHNRRDIADQSLSSYDLSLTTQAAKTGGWTDSELCALIQRHRETNGDFTKGIRRDYLERTIGKARAALARQVGQIEPPLTDSGNAQRLFERHGQDIRYCYPEKTWYVWNGKVWGRDDSGRIVELTKETARAIHGEAVDFTDSDIQKKINKWAISSQSERAIRAMEKLARSLCPVLPDQFDTNSMLLNVQNGVIDLQTGQHIPHSRDFLMRKMSAFTFDATATSPQFDRFLQWATRGDTELERYLMAILGYSMSGDTSQESFYILFGPPESGKTTIIELMKELLADYAGTAEDRSFLSQRFSSMRDDLASLVGKRFVAAVEPEKGKSFDGPMLKRISGRDTVRCAQKYEKSFEYRPTYKLYIGTNELPDVDASDTGLWRRLKVIPFNARFEKRDNFLRERMRKTEAAGILNRLIAGCLDWTKNGLIEPAAVKQAIAVYRDDADLLADFLSNNCCIPDKPPTGRKAIEFFTTPIGEFSRRFNSWLEAARHPPLTSRKISAMMRGREKGPFQVVLARGKSSTKPTKCFRWICLG